MTTARIAMVLALLLSGCAKHDPNREIHFRFSEEKSSPFVATVETQLAALDSADPLTDAKVAYRRGDYRLVAVLGIGLSTPGVTLESTKRLPGPHRLVGTKVISGTSDMIENETHNRMIRRAHEYATAYNAQLIVLLTTGGKEGTD